MSDLIYIVKSIDSGKTVKEILNQQFKLSNRLLIELKRNNYIFLNNVPTSVNNTIYEDDELKVYLGYKEDVSNIVPIKMDLDILYEDEYLIAINKPYNMPVHPSMDHYEDSLSNGVRYYFNSIDLHKKTRPINRLDKDTTGIVLFAKNKYIQEYLNQEMKTKEFKKEYITYVYLNDEKLEETGTIDFPIGRKEGSIIERTTNPKELMNGFKMEKAITNYEVLEINKEIGIAKIKCILETGRTHQIRLHFDTIKHPLVGETLYNHSLKSTTKTIDFPHQALHCFKLSFIHPITKKKIEIISDYETDLTNKK